MGPMTHIDSSRRVSLSRTSTGLSWRIGSALTCCAALALLVAAYTEKIQTPRVSEIVFLFVLATLGSVFLLHTRFLRAAHKQQRQVTTALQRSEREFQSVFENALDTILILDDSGVCRDVNPAALQLLHVSRTELIGQTLAAFFRHTEEFDATWSRIREQTRDHGTAEFLLGNGSAVFVEFSARAGFLPGLHLMILRDITQRRRAEEEVRGNLALAQSAWSEADALRKATLAITQDLRMDFVLQKLLLSLQQLVPFESAQVLLAETETRLFLAREVLAPCIAKESLSCQMTFNTSEHPLLGKAMHTQTGILLRDTKDEGEWRSFHGQCELRSWLCVPLFAGDEVLGLLSLVHSSPEIFTTEHLRLAKSLAIPAAVAIQNSRLFERAAIYGEELERRIADIERTKRALQDAEEENLASEDRFQKVFRSSPIAFSVTTLAEGRYVEVNEAFERRFGYTRAEILGRTAGEIRIWVDPAERDELVAKVRGGSSVRNAMARLRTKSGESILSQYSAETIQLDGQSCLLVVSDDLAVRTPEQYN